MVSMVQVVADLAGVEISVSSTSEESKAPHGRFPYLE